MTPTCSSTLLCSYPLNHFISPFPSPAGTHLKASCLFRASALQVLLLGRVSWSLSPLGAPPHSVEPQQALHPHCQAQGSSRGWEQ